MRRFLQKLQWRTRARKEAELREELQFHLDEEAAELREAGASENVAQAHARRDLGNFTLVQEDVRSVWTWAAIDAIVSDWRFALRSIRKNPLVSVAVAVTLTVGIGLNASVFTVVNGVALRPRIDRDPASFAEFLVTYTQQGARRHEGPGTLPDFLAMQQAARTLTHLTAWSQVRVPFSADDPTQLRGLLVACNFFSVHSPAPGSAIVRCSAGS